MKRSHKKYNDVPVPGVEYHVMDNEKGTIFVVDTEKKAYILTMAMQKAFANENNQFKKDNGDCFRFAWEEHGAAGCNRCNSDCFCHDPEVHENMKDRTYKSG